jgi:hypothetical protein
MRRNTRTLSQSVDAFVVSILQYGEFILKDSRITNRHYADFTRALKRIVAYGDDGLSALAKLLEDDRIVVRATVACYLIHVRTERAKNVLEETAKLEDRAIAMLAVATLERWEKGIYLDPATGKETVLPPRVMPSRANRDS